MTSLDHHLMLQRQLRSYKDNIRAGELAGALLCAAVAGVQELPTPGDDGARPMAPKGKGKKGGQDRPFLDMAGAPPAAQAAEAAKEAAKEAGKDAENFLKESADDDRVDAKTKHANKGLRTAKDVLATMTKSAAHGLASDSDEIKYACLDELAELGSAISVSARAALRSSKEETRNLQDKKK